eukprot:scaffold154_cov373-Prasinococcus_capsulatus_cf.AAC.10
MSIWSRSLGGGLCSSFAPASLRKSTTTPRGACDMSLMMFHMPGAGTCAAPPICPERPNTKGKPTNSTAAATRCLAIPGSDTRRPKDELA